MRHPVDEIGPQPCTPERRILFIMLFPYVPPVLDRGVLRLYPVVGSAARGGTVTYVVSVQNDAPFPDAMRLKGTASNSRFTVKYTTGGSGITNGVIGGTYTTPVLAPGATFTVKIQVTVAGNAPAGSSLSATLITKSNTELARKDTVKFVTNRS